MLAFGRGDEAAFDLLFSRWGGRLLGYLQRMVSDLATAEELVQETFLRVHRARERYQAESRFSTWLYRIGTNLALNELRRPRRKRLHARAETSPAPGPNAHDDGSGTWKSDCKSDSKREEAQVSLVAGGSGVDALADARRAVAAVTAALGDLPERQRMALWLSAVEGFSYAEVAEALETSEKSVKSLVHRARASLAERLPALAVGASPRQASRAKSQNADDRADENEKEEER